MRTYHWDIDEDTRVEVCWSGVGKVDISCNETPILSHEVKSRKATINCSLEDGRQLEVTVELCGILAPNIDIKCDGKSVIALGDGRHQACSCGVRAKIDDRYCWSCGKPFTVSQKVVQENAIKNATIVLWILAFTALIASIFSLNTSVESYQQDLQQLEKKYKMEEDKSILFEKEKRQLAYRYYAPVVVNIVFCFLFLICGFYRDKASFEIFVAAMVFLVFGIAFNIKYSITDHFSTLILFYNAIVFIWQGMKSAYRRKEDVILS